MNMADVKVGQRIVWFRELRDGYGWQEPIDGVVKKIGKRVSIRVVHRKHGLVTRAVAAHNIVLREHV